MFCHFLYYYWFFVLITTLLVDERDDSLFVRLAYFKRRNRKGIMNSSTGRRRKRASGMWPAVCIWLSFFDYLFIGGSFVDGFAPPAFEKFSKRYTILQVKQEVRPVNSSSSSLPPRPASAPRKKRVVSSQPWKGASIPESVPRLSEVLQRQNNNPKDSSSSNVNDQRKAAPAEAWKAGYYTSLKSQKRIQFAASSSRNQSPLQQATRVLQTFLALPPSKCNAANVVCALTLSAKVMGRETSNEFRSLLYRTMDVVSHLLVLDSQSATGSTKYFSMRQLCNIIWAVAKHSDRDTELLPQNPEALALSTEQELGRAETWDLRDVDMKTPEKRLDAVVDEIARQMADRLEEDDSAAKEGELCMASWAYGVLRRRRRPPGWRQEPQLGQLPTSPKRKESNDDLDLIRFEQWEKTDGCDDLEPPSPTDILFDKIGQILVEDLHNVPEVAWEDELPLRLQACRWNELANLAWAFASHGRSCSASAEELMLQVAHEATRRLQDNTEDKPLSRDIAQIVWALGTLQADNFRIAAGLVEFATAIGDNWIDKSSEKRPLTNWSCPDLVQVALSLAHARLDDIPLLRAIYAESCERLGSDLAPRKRWNGNRKTFLAWEISILLWSQARLHMTEKQGDVFSQFGREAVISIQSALKVSKSLASIGLGPQEQANMAWSMTVLELQEDPAAEALLRTLFSEAASTCKEKGVIQLEHAHQLWQAMFVLEGEHPECVAGVPAWFRDYLQQKWLLEKSRVKISSARHKSLSKLLHLMGVDHVNEHDEDIDVAIVVKQQATWTHETESQSSSDSMKLAVEFDGPNHFTRESPDRRNGEKAEHPRALGHTVLKYRLLKQQGWTVVRVPYYEFDKIPFWASMERQRYLQRLLKTHCNIRFSEVDVSEYKKPVNNRNSRFD